MKKNIKEYFILIIGVCFLFQTLLQTINDIFKYIDEFVAVIMILYYIKVIIKRKKINKSECKIILCSVAVFFLGLCSNFCAMYQTNIIPILWDAFNVFKVFFTFLGTMYFFKENVKKDLIIQRLSSIIRILLFIAILCWGISLVVDIGMNNSEIRFGIKSFDFIYGGAGIFAMYLYLYLYILTLDLKYNNNFKKRLFIYILIFLCFTTLRTRAIVFMIIYSYLYFKFINNKKIRIKWYHIAVGIIAAILIGYNSIQVYFSNDSKTARNVFLRNSIEIAKDNIPLGTGFATYGTDVAYTYYSNVYYYYHMDRVYGLSKEFGAFCHDTYWPAILGQFGIFGILFMIILIYNVYKILLSKVSKNSYSYLSIIYTILVLTIASIATATFFHYSTVAWIFLIPLAFEDKEVKKMEEKNVRSLY